MESRGTQNVSGDRNRPPISRRSCDYCRARKIGCDRGSPCANCVAARLNCTYSKIASPAPTPKQRILLSSQYEKKIDDIARGIEEVKLLLNEPRAYPRVKEPESVSSHSFKHDSTASPRDQQTIQRSTYGHQQPRDNSAFIINFVNCVTRFPDPGTLSLDSSATLSSLKSLVQSLDSPTNAPSVVAAEPATSKAQSDKPRLPPMDAAISVLKWVKDHEEDPRIAWISHILSFQMFTDICKTVYFAVDEYSEVKFLLANGVLSYIFAAHVTITGAQEYLPFCHACHSNVRGALKRLPLLMPTSIEAVAALILGALTAIESSDSFVAWTLVSNASDLCQRMGWDYCSRSREPPEAPQSVAERLFVTVYRIEKALSLRLERISSFRDATARVPVDSQGRRLARLGRLQESVWGRLDVARSLISSPDDHSKLFEKLTEELLETVGETQRDCFSSGPEIGPLRVVCLQSELACQSSVLLFLLEHTSSVPNPSDTVSDNLVAIARCILDAYRSCMVSIFSWISDPLLIAKYFDWCTWHTPFAPFSILFSRVVKSFDFDDLGRLETFATSMKSMDGLTEWAGHPYRLYDLLGKAARLHIQAEISWCVDPDALMQSYASASGDFDFASLGLHMNDPALDETVGTRMMDSS